jgi:hypothetical protein
MTLQIAFWLQYPVLAILFVSQAMYMKYHFEEFRRKVYMDVMDYLIIQAKRQNGGTLPDDFEEQIESFSGPRLRLVSNKKK